MRTALPEATSISTRLSIHGRWLMSATTVRESGDHTPVPTVDRPAGRIRERPPPVGTIARRGDRFQDS